MIGNSLTTDASWGKLHCLLFMHYVYPISRRKHNLISTWMTECRNKIIWTTVYALYSAAMCGVCPETLMTWPWHRLSMIYCCALRHWSQICVTCQSCWFLGSVALSCAGASCLVPVGWRHMYEIDMEHFANQNLGVVVVKCWLLGFVV